MDNLLQKIKNNLQYVFGLIGILLAAIWILIVRKNSAEALTNNLDTKNKVLDLDREQAKLGAQADIEQLKRDLEAKNAEELKKLPLSPRDFN